MLERSFTSRVRRGLTYAMLVGSVYACGKDVVKPPVNHDPQITLSVDPSSGVDPLRSQIQYTCTDLDGPEDIAESRLTVGTNTFATTSLDSIFTFNESSMATPYCRDLSGKVAVANPVAISVTHPPQPSYSQTATVNGTSIVSNVTLTNLEEASLDYLRENGDTVATRTITPPGRTETFTDAHKGNNRLILSAPGLAPDTVTANVTNYKPTMDLEGLATDIEEGEQITIDLKGRVSDINPEDNLVPMIRATSLDGRMTSTLDGYLLTLTGILSGLSAVELEFGSREGGVGLDTLVKNVVEVPEQIAFWRSINGNEDIYSAKLVNGKLEEITRETEDSAQDFEPAWSPNGRYLAFTSNRGGAIGIHIKDMDTGNITPLIIPGIGYAKDAAWSPDGSKIALAYIDFNLSSNGILLMNPDGTGFDKLIENSGTGTVSDGLSWSRDGLRIFYDMFKNGNWDIFSIGIDGSNETNITNTPYNENLPSVSPIGDRLAFVSNQFGGEFSGLEAMSMALDGTDVRRITNTFEMEVDPTYSNDGTKLIYSRWNSAINAWQMFLANSDGTGEIFINAEGSDRYAVFKLKQ